MSTEFVATVMKHKGGKFGSKLGELWLVADQPEREILEAAFSGIFAHYAEVAEKYTAFNQGVDAHG